MKFSSDLGYLLNWTTVSQAVWCFFFIEDVSELNSESRRWRNYTAGDVAVVSFISQVNQLSWLFWRNLIMSQLTPRDARDVFSCPCALWSRLKVVVWFCFCFAFSNTRLDSSLLEKKMLEKLSRYFAAEGELLHGRSRWTSAAVAVVFLGLFASSCWADEASCHGAFDLYFVLDK